MQQLGALLAGAWTPGLSLYSQAPKIEERDEKECFHGG
jgi:hypothetical protein